MLKENYLKILERVKKACDKINKDYRNITIVSVSKTFKAELIKEIYDAGHRDFGENYIQEALKKIEKLPDDIRWHYVGRLQTNKCKDAVGRFSLIHSVDSLKLLNEISKRAELKNIKQNILLQINFHKEETKAGFQNIDELIGVIEAGIKLKNINIRGLMTIPPFTDNPENTRPHFAKLRETFELIKTKYSIDRFDILSMGMTDDFEVAIEEGANYIRIGRAIFGERKYD
ncbi:MAG: YggS family pyridoxal phosphate-dependent enzyme [Candidatus Hydrogenedentota bacterium]